MTPRRFVRLQLSRLLRLWRAGWAGRVLLLSALLLLPGLMLPVLTVDTLATSATRYSIVQGVWELLTNGKVGLAVLIFGFSVLFPVLKLGLLVRYCVHPDRFSANRWLLWLGKWSMLDVFVVAVLTGAGRLRLLSTFESAPGVYWFAAAIVLTMVGAELLLKLPGNTLDDSRPTRREKAATALPLAGLALLAAGLATPLMEVNKWLFWRNAYSLLAALPKMLEEGEWLLPLILVLTVVLAPMIRLAASMGYRLTRRSGCINLHTLASQWSMLSVFVLALLLVMLKLGAAASVEPRLGLWLLAGAGLVSGLDRWLLNRRTQSGMDVGSSPHSPS